MLHVLSILFREHRSISLISLPLPLLFIYHPLLVQHAACKCAKDKKLPVVSSKKCWRHPTKALKQNRINLHFLRLSHPFSCCSLHSSHVFMLISTSIIVVQWWRFRFCAKIPCVIAYLQNAHKVCLHYVSKRRIHDATEYRMHTKFAHKIHSIL